MHLIISGLFFLQSWGSVHLELDTSSRCWADEQQPFPTGKSAFIYVTKACVCLCNMHLSTKQYVNHIYLIIFLFSPAKSFSADKPRPFLQPHRQTIRLRLPQGHRKRQLWKGSFGPPPERWEVLCSQGAAKESHLEEERGMVFTP